MNVARFLAGNAGHPPTTVNRGCILLVDDDPAIHITVGGRLELEHYTILHASCAEDALELFTQCHTHLVILDVAMPGLGGLGFLKAMEQRLHASRCPIVIFTARSRMESFFNGTPGLTFLSKTSDPEQLVTTVNRVIDEQRSADNPAHLGQWTILLVDDDEEHRFHLHHIFGQHGLELHACEADEHLVAAVIEQRPCAILIKYILPGHNGPSVAHRLAEHPETRNIPVLLFDDTRLHENELPSGNVLKFIGTMEDKELLQAVLQIVQPPPAALTA